MYIAKWKKPIWKLYTLYDSVYKEILKVLVTRLYPTLRPQWTKAHQAPLSMGLSRQEYWNG